MTVAKSPADFLVDPLNDPQREAVLHSQGPLLILAGAGSGKTRALTHRIARLMRDGVAPWQVLAVTFTNKAAQQMKDRITNLLHISEGQDLSAWGSKQGKLPTMGTFHSICVRILRRDIERLGRDRHFVIYDQDDQEKLMKEILKELKIDDAILKPRAGLSYLTRFKSEAVYPKQVTDEATSDRMHQIASVYKRYQQRLAESNALDFDDLILETVRLFTECPDVLDRYQEMWRFLHVDEYQDTNHAQYLFITLLAQKYRNLCVIGDPDQSIYGFRGADIRNILEFESDYPDAKRIKLEQNYRSVQPILTAADTVIAANPNRPEKRMWTERKDGALVVVHEVRDEQREAEEAIRAVKERNAEGISLKDQVILYRTHAQSRLFEEACMREGLPYRIIGGVKFYARREVKDVLAYLHVILNPQDTLSLLRIINVPSRKIGDVTLGRLQAHASAKKLNLWDTLNDVANIPDLEDGVRMRITKFTELIEQHRTLAQTFVVSALTEQLLSDLKLKEWLTDDTDEGEERWENVLELLSVMHKYDALDPRTALTSFLEEVALVSAVDVAEHGDALTLMSLHLCKGLEFEHVIVAGCEEGLLPHSSSLFDREQLEEERRLLYVGMTRAKSHLKLLFTQSRFLWGNRQNNAPSRFLDDLPDDVIERRSDDLLSAFSWSAAEGEEKARSSGTAVEPYRQHADVSVEFNQDGGADEASQDPFEKGVRIAHPVFGEGIITARRGDVVEVKFDSGQKKSFALSIAPLKVL